MLRLLVNLDTSTERLARMTQRFKELGQGLEFERLSAVDGRKLSADQIRSLTYPIDHFPTKVKFTRALKPGEIGCFLSHRECWKRLLASSEEWALVIEDDVLISDLALPYMLSDSWIPTGVDYCQLSCQKEIQHGRILHDSINVDGLLTLVSPIAPTPLGTMSYLISRKVAKRALELSEKLPAPVDNFMFSPWFDLVHEFTLYRVAPTFVIPHPSIESEIGTRAKKDVEKAPFFIRHGLTRMLMDFRVKMYQRQGVPYVFQYRQK